MFSLAAYFRRRSDRPYVRPWALSVPILVLLFCLPLLRPLRHPARVSVDEELRLATISALVDHAAAKPDSSDNQPVINAGISGWFVNHLALDARMFWAYPHLILVNNRVYSDQPPMLALLLSAPYRILRALGFGLEENSVLVPYLLTVLGVTLPAAGAAGLIYRMGRVFELRRPWRCGLAAAVVFGTGLVSYAVVLNPYVPAAFLVLASAGSLVHLASSAKPGRGGGWLVLAGLYAALAATIHPPAVIFLILFLAVIVAMRLHAAHRILGVALYSLGALLPLGLYAALTIPLTGNLLPASLHPELAIHRQSRLQLILASQNPDPSAVDSTEDDVSSPQPGFWQTIWAPIGRIVSVLFGVHGLLVHFPIVLLGFVGMLAVMHRHWPATTKILAAASATGICIGLLLLTLNRPLLDSSEYAASPLLVFLPILLFWAGAWLRRAHHPAVWSVVGVLLAFSVIVTLIGATDPTPPAGYDRYTPVAAIRNMIYSPSPYAATTLAGR